MQGADPQRREGTLDALYACVDELARRAFADQRGAHTLQPTALAHEAWIRLERSGARWNDDEHMRAVVARTLRTVLVDHARRRTAAKRGGGRGRVTFVADEHAVHGVAADRVELIALDAALEELARSHERAARVVELRFFGGLTVTEAAAVLDVARSTVDDEWRFARAWLRRALTR